MLKKILIGVLSTLVVTAVGASAYNTTLKSGLAQSELQVQAAVVDETSVIGDVPVVSQAPEQVVQPQNQVRGAANGPGSPTASGEPLSANASQGRTSGQGRGNRFGSGGSGRQSQTGSADGSAVPTPQNGLTEWISLEGMVSQVAYPTFTLTSADGQSFLASLGNLIYATSLGIDLTDGETVSLTGFWDTDGTLAVGSLLADGQTFSLRDEYGRPLWSGGARP